MPQSFDAYQYLEHLRERWRFAAVACCVAAAVSLCVSMLLPKKYTATSRLLIEPPAGSDMRAAMAVSPVYLESLRTYEMFAASDDLFLQAVKRFGLRHGNQPVDRLKRSILKVGLARNTKIVEISATLPDPEKAHGLAVYVAEETVKLNRSANRAGDQELIVDAERQLNEAHSRVQQADEAWAQQTMREPTRELEQQIESSESLKAKLQEELLAAELNVAEYQDREKTLIDKPNRAGELESVQAELRFARVRIENSKNQMRDLQREIRRQQGVLSERLARRDRLQTGRKSAQVALEGVENRVREARSSVGYRGERLRVIDPGVVPERPSSPNIPLNVLAAITVALVSSLLYLTLQFSWRLQKADSPRPSFRAAGRDD